MRIAIQGEAGSFSHQAALLFAPDAEIAPCKRAAEAFAELREGTCDAIALPLENTLAGSVVEHYDLLLGAPIHIEREILVRIEHALIGIPGSTESTIRRAYSHPVALAQCRNYLAAHPEIEPVPFYDTAGAVKQLIELRDRHAAAIAGALAAEIYGGIILTSRIEDDPANFTRFLLLRPGAPAPNACPPHGPAKLSMAFSAQHRPGALVAALQVLAEADANLTKVQTRPVHGHPWRYTFYVDCLLKTPAGVPELLAALRTRTLTLQNFGCYPPAEASEAVL